MTGYFFFGFSAALLGLTTLLVSCELARVHGLVTLAMVALADGAPYIQGACRQWTSGLQHYWLIRGTAWATPRSL